MGKCRFSDGTDIIMCFKCLGYTCYKCLGNHKSKECDKEILSKCVNCIGANKILNMGLNENHVTTDKECPVNAGYSRIRNTT